MKISQKGLYALQAMTMLARRYNQGAIRIRDIAYEEGLPEKFLELILVELRNARMVESVRGAKGGYRLRRAPSEIHLAEIIRLIDGALAPFGDAAQLRSLIETDVEHRALYQVFLDVRDAAARILENTTLADLIEGTQDIFTIVPLDDRIIGQHILDVCPAGNIAKRLLVLRCSDASKLLPDGLLFFLRSQVLHDR